LALPQPVPPPNVPKTPNSHSEYPNWVARAVPFIRTYRPLPVTGSVWVPPVPVVVLKMVVQADPSGETWIWNDRAYAASHTSVTWSMAAVWPRSTRIHCGSLNWLDQRVPVLPSTAAVAGVPAFSWDEARTGRPWDSSGPAALAGRAVAT
jgi:hypothetical protein